jgi:hypothetical protein
LKISRQPVLATDQMSTTRMTRVTAWRARRLACATPGRSIKRDAQALKQATCAESPAGVGGG